MVYLAYNGKKKQYNGMNEIWVGTLKDFFPPIVQNSINKIMYSISHFGVDLTDYILEYIFSCSWD